MSVPRVPGEGFGRYVIEAELGRGGQAVVYRARQRGTERAVALKIFDEIDDPSKRARFLREAVAAARVEHPRIVTVYESGEVEGVPFLAMRLVPGPSLAEVLSRFGPIPPARALAILADVADAVDAVHGHGLVHRDIKPANVLLDLDDTAYLSDFGVARLQDLPRLTVRGDWLGTAEYVSPEQAEGRPATAASDIYAFGVLAFEVLAGRPPFVHRQMSALLVAHARDAPPSIRTLNPSMPAAVDAVLAGALHKDPAARPSRARRVVDALAEALAGHTGDGPGGTLVGVPGPQAWTRVMRRISTGDGPAGHTRALPRPAPPPPPARRRRRGRRITAALVAVAVLGTSAAAAGWYASESAAGDVDTVRTAAYRQGFSNGKARGVAQGRATGEAAGRRAGEAAGLKRGKEEGYREGLAEGRRVPDASPGDYRVVRAADDGTAEYVSDVLDDGRCFRIEDDGSVTVIGSSNPFSVCSDALR